MKKLLFILPVIFFTFSVAAQTEDEVYIGKGKTFGNYKAQGIIIPDVGRTTKPINGLTEITGVVVGYCKKDCCYMKSSSCSVDVKKDDGTIVTIGTRDNGFTVPKAIVGKIITVQGKDAGQISGIRDPSIRVIKDVTKDPQQDIQFAATGIKIIN
ncbi:MAG TPA: hypothetical protein VLJ68_02120 [Chitinophagaceae bacterium]|nr:hypothetical protein [Chitinophagaceae bacterium]